MGLRPRWREQTAILSLCAAKTRDSCGLTLVKVKVTFIVSDTSTSWLLLTPQDPDAEVALGSKFASSYFCSREAQKRRDKQTIRGECHLRITWGSCDWQTYVSQLDADPQSEVGEQTSRAVHTDGVVSSGGSGEGGSGGGSGSGDRSCDGMSGGTNRGLALVGDTNGVCVKGQKRNHLCKQGKYRNPRLLMILCTLTVFPQCPVADKSLYEHIPQRLIYRHGCECFFAHTRVEGVEAYVCDIRVNGDVCSS